MRHRGRDLEKLDNFCGFGQGELNAIFVAQSSLSFYGSQKLPHADVSPIGLSSFELPQFICLRTERTHHFPSFRAASLDPLRSFEQAVSLSETYPLMNSPAHVSDPKKLDADFSAHLQNKLFNANEPPSVLLGKSFALPHFFRELLPKMC